MCAENSEGFTSLTEMTKVDVICGNSESSLEEFGSSVLFVINQGNAHR